MFRIMQLRLHSRREYLHHLNLRIPPILKLLSQRRNKTMQCRLTRTVPRRAHQSRDQAQRRAHVHQTRILPFLLTKLLEMRQQRRGQVHKADVISSEFLVEDLEVHVRPVEKERALDACVQDHGVEIGVLLDDVRGERWDGVELSDI